MHNRRGPKGRIVLGDILHGSGAEISAMLFGGDDVITGRDAILEELAKRHQGKIPEELQMQLDRLFKHCGDNVSMSFDETGISFRGAMAVGPGMGERTMESIIREFDGENSGDLDLGEMLRARRAAGDHSAPNISEVLAAVRKHFERNDDKKQGSLATQLAIGFTMAGGYLFRYSRAIGDGLRAAQDLTHFIRDAQSADPVRFENLNGRLTGFNPDYDLGRLADRLQEFRDEPSEDSARGLAIQLGTMGPAVTAAIIDAHCEGAKIMAEARAARDEKSRI